ncbi:MAG: glycosyltransferase family 9 protein [Gemmatimonadota bacterium]
MSQPVPLRHRILAIRFSSIGDILLTTPLLRAIRRRLPDAYLAMLTKDQFAPLVQDNPRLNDVITLGKDQSLASLAGDLRAKKFTHILDLHGSLRTRALRLLVPARWSGYHNHRVAREILIRFKRNLYPREIPVPERYFDAARELGVQPDGDPPEFFLREKAKTEASDWLVAGGLPVDRGMVAIAPGAAHNTKRWPVEYWQSLAHSLTTRGVPIVVVGGPEDREIAQTVTASGEGGLAMNAAGQFGLQGTGALLGLSRALISGDTGVMHMATAVNIPVIALFGPTVRAFGFFPYSAQAVVLERDLDCRPCTAWGTEHCPLGHHHCLRGIVPSEVDLVLQRVLT